MSSSGEAAKLGRYELITRIGEGGMAEVQLALQRGPGGFEKLVVVKLVHAALASQRQFVDMLLDEARVAALVKHPNVVDIYDLGEADGRFFIAMEYLEGEPLLAVLRAGRDGQRLDVMSTARLIADTAEGLEAAHELRSLGGDPLELVHHDVSLGNIVVLYNGSVKLVDFGVAKATQSAATRTKVQGKFSYMAPEKLRGGAGDRRSDIWSLGVVLWEALTLRRLFKGGNESETMQQVLTTDLRAPSMVNGDVPPAFDPIVMRALARDPADRYASAKALAEDLEAVLQAHGYAAKNDAIARYMQATFATHIAARKKLLQEVAQKGAPSQDLVDAAFDDARQATGTPQRPRSDSHSGLSGEFAVRFRRAPSEVAAPGSIDDSIASAISASGSGPTNFGASNTPSFSRLPSPAMEEPALVVDRGHGTRTTPARGGAKKRAAIALGLVGALGVAGATIAISMRGGGDEAAQVARAPAAKPVELPAIPAPDAAVAEPAVVAVATPDAASTPTTTAPIAPPAKTSPPTPPPAPHKPDVDALFETGVQAFVHGDNQGAFSIYKRVVAASPAYAPAWRGLGLVYERLGERTDARAAFAKYLQLAPNAPDAPTIRARLEKP